MVKYFASLAAERAASVAVETLGGDAGACRVTAFEPARVTALEQACGWAWARELAP